MNMAIGKLEYVFLKITHFNNSFIMLYTEYFTLRDCSGFLQIRSHFMYVYKRVPGSKAYERLPLCKA